MKLSSRAVGALLVIAAAAAPARAPAQDGEAWVLPRGLLELGGSGLFVSYHERMGLGDPPFAAEFVAPLQAAADRVIVPAETSLRSGLADLFASVPDPDPSSAPAADALSAGRVALRATADVREAPLTLRYGLTGRLTLSLTVPLERRGTSFVGPYLAGGTLGINPNRAANRETLRGVDERFADFGGGLLLPVAGTPQAVELQARLRALSPDDTLVLPRGSIAGAALLASAEVAELLTEQERAALGLSSARTAYHLGDAQLGARFLLVRGPAGWPYPDSVRGRAFRTSVGGRLRLPTGRGGTAFTAEIPAGGGHPGVGADLLNDVFLSRRWMVNASASVDVLFPADVLRPAFSAADPLPPDTVLRTMRRAPGPRLAVTLSPRWRLTDEMSFSGEYSLLAQGRVRYTGGEEGLLPTPLEWRTGGSLHAAGVGVRYSSLQAYARGRANVPFEVTLSLARAFAGGGAAPEAALLRVTGRVFVDPRRARALLPRTPPPADTIAPPAGGPADTLPSQLRPETPPVLPAVPVRPDTLPADTTPTPAPPPAPAVAAARRGDVPAPSRPGLPFAARAARRTSAVREHADAGTGRGHSSRASIVQQLLDY